MIDTMLMIAIAQQGGPWTLCCAHRPVSAPEMQRIVAASRALQNAVHHSAGHQHYLGAVLPVVPNGRPVKVLQGLEPSVSI